MRLVGAKVIIAIALIALTAIAFAPALGNGFVNYDDGDYVSLNPQVQAGLTWPSVRWALTTSTASNWHPLTWWSLELDRTLFGPGPFGFHLSNIVLHALNAVLLFLVIARVTSALWRSAWVAAIFAIHPLRVESVAWVSERKDVLCIFFGLLTILAYVRYVRRPGWITAALVAVPFALSLLAKPMLVTLPCLLLVLDWWPLGRWSKIGSRSKPFKWLVLEKGHLFALSAMSCVATIWAQRAGGAVATLQEFSLVSRIDGALVAYVRYLGMAIWPVDLIPFYPYPRNGYSIALVLLAIVILAAVSILAIRFARQRPYVLVGWLWFLGTLIPTIGLVQVGEQSIADRYTYFPLIGISLIIAWSIGEGVANFRWGHFGAIGLSVAMIAGLVVVTREQVRTWHDSLTLWNHALSVDGKNFFAHYNVGILRHADGKLDLARRHLADAATLYPEFIPAQYQLGEVELKLGLFDEAERHLRTVVQKQPQSATAHNQLGAAITRQGRVAEGIREFEEALRLDPSDADSHNNLGMAYGVLQQTTESMAHFREALRLQPDFAEAHRNLAMTLEKAGRRSEAIEEWRKVVQLRPRTVAPLLELAQALFNDGQVEQARSEYREILSLDPTWLDRTQKTAWRLAAQTENRNGPQALILAQQILQATGRDQLPAADILAAAHAANGEFDQAVAVIREAIRQSEARAESADVIRQLGERLKQYESHQPLRDPLGNGPLSPSR